VIDEPSLITDLLPTLLGLLDLPAMEDAHGFDWSRVGRGVPAPAARLTRYQAHKGAVMSKHDSDLARRSGLLAVGTVRDGRKEIYRFKGNELKIFDLARDPGEIDNLARDDSALDAGIRDWMDRVQDQLSLLDESTPEPLNDEEIEQLRSLGYIE
jgi:arylsulfatase A-like enzyme